MPFTPAETAKCPRCSKSVYAAEEKNAGGFKWHSGCFKCSMCNKMLDSTNVNCHDQALFCKTCHGRKYGPKGYGFGGGAAGLNMDTGAHLEEEMRVKAYKPPKAEDGQGCPRCGGKVYMAEEMMAKGRVYHRTCFNCKQCRKPLDSVVHCDGPDKEVYCKVCYGKKYGPKGYGFGHGGGTLTCDPESTPLVRPHGNPDVSHLRPTEGEQGCPRCGGKVFMAEEMMAKGKPWHKKCFKCLFCKRPLDSMIHCDGADGEIYCKLCYAKKYGPKGYGFAAGAGGVLSAENIPGGEELAEKNTGRAALDTTAIKAKEGEGCPRCGGKVFMAEEMNSKGKSWHKTCFNCGVCHRPLDSVVCCDAADGEIYCKLCYAKKYGPKGYGFAAGAGGVLTAENIPGGGGEMSQVKNPTLAALDVAKIQAKPGEGCPRCGGKVYAAEEMHARGRVFHHRCYNCCCCHRPLDSVVGCDAPDGEVYCKLCYAKKYGPKGYGFAAGSGGLLVAENIPGGDAMPGVKPAYAEVDTSVIPDTSDKGCPRCFGKVFAAEERLSRTRRYHKRCYNCLSCKRPLDSMVCCDGSDGEIYCKLCYAKKYGPKGYGFAAGAGGVLSAENIPGGDDFKDTTAARGELDVARIPAKAGQARCPRCGGAVFQAESQQCRGKEWHRRCYNCCECHRPLDSMLSCDAPDGEIYCKLCYAKRHGPKGYGYGHSPALVSLGSADGVAIPTDIRQFGFGAKKPSEWMPPMPGAVKEFLMGQLTGQTGTSQERDLVNSSSEKTEQTIEVTNEITNGEIQETGPVQAVKMPQRPVPYPPEQKDIPPEGIKAPQVILRKQEESSSSEKTVQSSSSSTSETTIKSSMTSETVVKSVKTVVQSSSSSVKMVEGETVVVGGVVVDGADETATRQAQVVPIVSGVKVEDGEAIPIVMGVSTVDGENN